MYDDEFRWRDDSDEPSRVGWWIVGLVVTFIVLGLGLSFCSKAKAHEWYPSECCHGRDCYAVKVTKDEIQITEQGYYIIPSNELIPFTDPRIREFPPDAQHGAVDDFHRCALLAGDDPDVPFNQPHSSNPATHERLSKARKGRTICLFVPRGGI